MAKFRSCSSFSCKNPNFIGVIFALLLSFALFLYQYFFIEQKVGAMMAVICCFYVLSLWSYVASVVTNPGSVPVYYGLYSEDIAGERKYCLLCHNFKPERSHHCSKCRQCVLNMDHHCPWINNCVGFDNRKYFVLFITYLLVALTLALIWMCIVLINQITTKTLQVNLHTVLKLLLFVKFVFLEITLGIFTVNHFRYVLTNLTTIEEMVMDRKRKAVSNKEANFTNYDYNEYDISPYYNFTQVFGDNPFYWLIPIASQHPLRGAGIRWDKNRDLLPQHKLPNNFSTR